MYLVMTFVWFIQVYFTKGIDDTYTSWCNKAVVDPSFDEDDLLIACDKSYYNYAWIQGPFSNDSKLNNLLDYCDLPLNTTTSLTDLYKQGKLNCLGNGNHWR